MNKKSRIALIVTSITLGLTALIFIGVNLKLKSLRSDFVPLETGKVVDDIFAVRDDYVNFFIIQDSTQYVVIDCGINQVEVAEQMKKLRIKPEDVVAVLLTHTDSDHVGALSLFNHAKLYMSKDEEQMINGQISRFLWFDNSISRTDYTLLEDRQIVQIGSLKIEGFLAPGHTNGTMAYIVNDKYLFSGDIVSLEEGKIAPFPAVLNMDRKQAVKSMEVIRHIPTVEYLFTGHYGYTGNYQMTVQRKDL